ncbi:hypothetical protein DPEC_G00103040 [Dallia pectoralis]|uniref:Uncharacterized protein n=1 Tax=Dallia pectoralis TaxID=75939 RepID=A0ACC2GX37_DALPE|nr:hypothetical protein DPEC_G00103040 [Dallia pectoralis]
MLSKTPVYIHLPCNLTHCGVVSANLMELVYRERRRDQRTLCKLPGGSVVANLPSLRTSHQKVRFELVQKRVQARCSSGSVMGLEVAIVLKAELQCILHAQSHMVLYGCLDGEAYGVLH